MEKILTCPAMCRHGPSDPALTRKRSEQVACVGVCPAGELEMLRSAAETRVLQAVVLSWSPVQLRLAETRALQKTT